jgi:hypothetical protein
MFLLAALTWKVSLARRHFSFPLLARLKVVQATMRRSEIRSWISDSQTSSNGAFAQGLLSTIFDDGD